MRSLALHLIFRRPTSLAMARPQRRISRRMYFAVEDGRLLFERLIARSAGSAIICETALAPLSVGTLVG